MVSKSHRSGRSRPLIGRILPVFSAAAFFSLSGTAIFRLYSTGLNQGQDPPVSADVQEAEQLESLKSQERGYEIVLEREPDNQTALEGLARARIQMDDIEGAIEPLDRLVEINPGRQDIVDLSNELKATLQDTDP